MSESLERRRESMLDPGTTHPENVTEVFESKTSTGTASQKTLSPLATFPHKTLSTTSIPGYIKGAAYFGLMIGVSILFGTASTLLSVLLSDIATRRYMRGRDLVLLVVFAILENCGYRQLNSWWGCVGTLQATTGKGGWGVMKRRAFESGR